MNLFGIRIQPSWFLCLLFLLLFFRMGRCQQQDAEIIRYVSLVEAGKDHLAQTDSVTLQINNREGERYSEISIPYSKEDRISDLGAWIETADGVRIRGIKKSEIVERSAISGSSLYEDHYKKCFQLKHNVYPYRVVYTYKISSRCFITWAWWTPVVDDELPTRSASLRVIVTGNIPFSRFEGNISGPLIDSAAAKISMEWSSSYEHPVKQEIFSRPGKVNPFVIVIPRDFFYDIPGSTRDWRSYGEWQYHLIRDAEQLPGEEKNTISALIQGVTDKREIVKRIYHYLQDHTRYINVSIGTGGLKPYPAEYVSINKYGDCKALTIYLKALLSYAGIESFYANVYAGEQPMDLIPGFAGPQFNHVVLAVPLNKDTLWLESTAATNPTGYMGTFTQNRTAFLVSEGKSRLVRIPALTREDNLAVTRLDYDIRLDGNAKVSVSSLFHGRYFEMLNQLHHDYTDHEKEQIIRDYMPYNNYEVITWTLKNKDRDTACICLNATLNLYKFLNPLGKEYCLQLQPSLIPPFTTPAGRRLPVDIPFPVYNLDTLSYKLPEGYAMKTRPDSATILTRFGCYRLKITAAGNKIVVTKRFELFPGSYTIPEYPEFYNFIKSIKNIDEKRIIIKPVI